MLKEQTKWQIKPGMNSSLICCTFFSCVLNHAMQWFNNRFCMHCFICTKFKVTALALFSRAVRRFWTSSGMFNTIANNKDHSNNGWLIDFKKETWITSPYEVKEGMLNVWKICYPSEWIVQRFYCSAIDFWGIFYTVFP